MTLNNKLEITDSVALAREEERITKKKALFLFESSLLDQLEPGRFSSLAKIHKILFEDIYDFAGKIRSENISKGNFLFASALYLEPALKSIENMPQSSFEEIVDKYVEMNVAHPFREGNGRSMRIWLDCMLKSSIQKVVDWSLIDKEAYLATMEKSPINSQPLKQLLQVALTSDINNREMFVKGIDHSYYYEGYYQFATSELSEI